MKNNAVRNAVFAVSLILAIVWMCVIFGFSANDAEESTVQSNAVTEILIRIFNPGFDDMTQAEKEAMIEQYDGTVRKLAHFCAYALLGCLLCVSACHAPFTVPLPYLWPLIISAVFAATDEYHQTFVDGRAGQFTDILIDTSGAVCGILFAVVVVFFINKKNSSRRGS